MFTISNETDYTKINVQGKLKHKDYIDVLLPKLDEISKEGKIKALIEMNDFSGIELKAIIDDMKAGIKHRKDFEKIAVVTDSSWMSTAVNIFKHVYSSDIQTFSDEILAKNWLTKSKMRYLHTMIRVKNLEESLDFYCNKLGLKEVNRTDNEKGKFTLVFLATHDDYEIAKINKSPLIELTYNWDSDEVYENGRNFGHLAFSVNNIYQTCKDLQNQGITINRPPRDGYMAFIKSPDGISIELLQNGDPLKIQEPWASMQNIDNW